jgi:hypothetical protein
MMRMKWALLIAAFVSAAGCADQGVKHSPVSAISPLSVTSDEGAYADPTTAPQGAQPVIRLSGKPGESGFDRASSALSGR